MCGYDRQAAGDEQEARYTPFHEQAWINQAFYYRQQPEWSMVMYEKPCQYWRFISIMLALSLAITLVSAPMPVHSKAGQYIVQGTRLDTSIELVESYGGTITSQLEIINGIGATLSPAAAAALSAEPEITAVTANAPVRTASKGKGPSSPETEYPEVVGAEVVWELGNAGRGVTVAVVDTGLGDHPGLTTNIDGNQNDRIVGWVDFVEGQRTPRDPNGHGTHVAGIIANSQTGPDGRMNGVAPGVRLVGVRVIDANGYGTYERVIQGIQWVVQNKDVFDIKVLNLSLVAPVQSPYWADPLNQAVMQAWAQGITVVAAAGNGGPAPLTLGSPGNNPYVITAGAFTDNFTPRDWSDDYITPFSAAGPTLDGFVKPDVIAPGAHMISSMLPSSQLNQNHAGNRLSPFYFSMAGTSQSTAVVSGIAALMLSHKPDLTPDQVKYRLAITSYPWIDLDSTNALYSIWQQGAGRVSAPDAVYTSLDGSANTGLDIWADLNGDQHYEGFSYYNDSIGEFRLKGEFSDWTGGYGNWAGGYGNWAGGYGNWAGGYGNWAGGYGNWAGGYGNWAGGYGNWAGGYGNWAGGYGNWAGSYGSAGFAEMFVNWEAGFGNWVSNLPWNGGWIDYDN